MGFFFRRASTPSVERFLSAAGSARTEFAVALLHTLREKPAAIPASWEAIELPLVQALPDCPPRIKPLLRAALEDCAGSCAHRDTARRMMIVRDSLRQ